MLFGFVGLLSRGPLGRSRRFLGQVSWVVLPWSWESLGQASNSEAVEGAQDSCTGLGNVLACKNKPDLSIKSRGIDLSRLVNKLNSKQLEW